MRPRKCRKGIKLNHRDRRARRGKNGKGIMAQGAKMIGIPFPTLPEELKPPRGFQTKVFCVLYFFFVHPHCLLPRRIGKHRGINMQRMVYFLGPYKEKTLRSLRTLWLIFFHPGRAQRLHQFPIPALCFRAISSGCSRTSPCRSFLRSGLSGTSPPRWGRAGRCGRPFF